MKIFSKNKEMRKNEITVTIVNIVCIIVTVVCLALWFLHQTQEYTTIAVVGVMSLIIAIVFSTMLMYRYLINSRNTK